MKSRICLLLPCLLVPVLLVFVGMLASHIPRAAAAGPGQSDASATPSATSQVVGAANAFLATLDEKQRAKVLFAINDDKQRARWSNFPTGMVPRGGVSLRELSDTQRAAAMALVSLALSARGFEKVQQIMEADDVFKATNHGPPPFARDHSGGQDHPPFDHDRPGSQDHPPFGQGNDGEHGHAPSGGADNGGHGHPPPGGDLFGKDLYYLSILGTPSDKTPWMLQYGGHHLALNITIVGARGVITPTLTGSQPATYTAADGKTVRPLGQENDKGFALLNALDDGQRKQAILNYRVADLVLGPGPDRETNAPAGLKASAMNEAQRALLLDLIAEWAGILNDAHAAARSSEIRDGLDDTYFAWSGPTTHEEGKNGSAYYRIQGPKVVIEFSPQGVGGDPTMHVHTMYRDPTNDYGRAFLNDAR